MFQKIKSYIGNISVYFTASLIPMFVSLLTNPLIALNMSPTDYAIVGYYTSFSTLLTPFITFYLVNYYNQRYFRVSDIERIELKATLIKTLIYFSFILSFISIVALLIYIIYFNTDFELPVFPYILLSILAIPLTGIYALTLNEYRLRRESKKFFKLSVGYGLLGVLLTLLFVVVFKDGARGKLLSTLLVNFCFFVVCILINKDCFKIKFNKTIFFNSVKFCWPLTIAAMLNFFSNGYDKVFLERLGNISELGYYTVGAQFAAYLQIFANAVQSTFQPDLYENIAKSNYRKTVQYVVIILGSISLVVFAYYLLAPFVINILTAGRYTMSVGYSQILSISLITSTAYYVSSQITIALGKSFVPLMTKSIGSLLIILLYMYMINSYGFYGAAWANIVSYLILLILNIIILTLVVRRDGIKNT